MGSQQEVYDTGLVSIEQGLRHMAARQSFTLLTDSQTAMLYEHPERLPGTRTGHCSSNHTSPRSMLNMEGVDGFGDAGGYGAVGEPSQEESRR